VRGRTILITGATAGIGREVALACAAAGANVVACGRRADAGARLVDEIRSLHGEALFVRADVTNEEDVATVVGSAVQRFGALDFAFNNAGMFVHEPVLDQYEDQQWHAHLAVGLTGTYHCMKHEVRAMLKRDGAHCAIVNNASTVAMRGSRASGVGYTVVKHGILGLTRQAAVEYAQTSIRVNAVCPGPTLTEATAPALARFDDDAARERFIGELNPTAELVDAADIAQIVMFLCTTKMINGQAIAIDGGQLAKL